MRRTLYWFPGALKVVGEELLCQPRACELHALDVMCLVWCKHAGLPHQHTVVDAVSESRHGFN